MQDVTRLRQDSRVLRETLLKIEELARDGDTGARHIAKANLGRVHRLVAETLRNVIGPGLEFEFATDENDLARQVPVLRETLVQIEQMAKAGDPDAVHVGKANLGRVHVLAAEAIRRTLSL